MLEDALRSGSAYQTFAVIQELDHHLRIQDENCRVMAKERVVGREGLRIARLVRVLESLNSNELVIQSHTNTEGHSFSGQTQLYEALYEHFAVVFWGGETLVHG